MTSEEEKKQHNSTQPIKIKVEYDEMNGCQYKCEIEIENDPIELILDEKQKLKRKKYTCYKRKVDNENCPVQ